MLLVAPTHGFGVGDAVRVRSSPYQMAWLVVDIHGTQFVTIALYKTELLMDVSELILVNKPKLP